MKVHPVYGLLAVETEGRLDTQDSLSNESFVRIANHLRRKVGDSEVPLPLSDPQFLITVQRADGSLIRSPDPEYLWVEKFAPSRDQIFMFLLFSWVSLHPIWFDRSWLWLKDQWPWYGNRDVQGLELLVIRARQRGWFLRKWIGDFSLVVNSYARCGYLPRWKHDLKSDDRVLFNLPKWTRAFWRFVPFDWDDVGDCKLHIATLAVVHFMGPSFLSRYATRFYFKNRPAVAGMTRERTYSYSGSGPYTALQHYFRDETGNSPEIATAWLPILDVLERVYCPERVVGSPGSPSSVPL